MAEYIERERIAMAVLGLAIVDPTVAQYADAVLWQIQNAPAADVAPVVRCAECIHYEQCEGGKDFCCFHATGIVPDDFCSCGEREEAEGDG